MHIQGELRRRNGGATRSYNYKAFRRVQMRILWLQLRLQLWLQFWLRLRLWLRLWRAPAATAANRTETERSLRAIVEARTWPRPSRAARLATCRLLFIRRNRARFISQFDCTSLNLLSPFILMTTSCHMSCLAAVVVFAPNDHWPFGGPVMSEILSEVAARMAQLGLNKRVGARVERQTH